MTMNCVTYWSSYVTALGRICRQIWEIKNALRMLWPNLWKQLFVVLERRRRMTIIKIIKRWIFMTDFVKGGGKLKVLRIVIHAGLHFFFFFAVALRNNSDPGRFMFEVFRSHTIRHNHTHTHTVGVPLHEWSARRWNWYLHNTQQTTTYEYSSPEQDANTRSQKSSPCRPTPYTARSSGSAHLRY